ncbi:hypothetical protein BDC45DRAFT_501532 [Circinella umbellata]|nr:hypothetical protein BDC45DRAFT_501532 [Circinella umbellata]
MTKKNARPRTTPSNNSNERNYSITDNAYFQKFATLNSYIWNPANYSMKTYSYYRILSIYLFKYPFFKL